MATRLRIDSLSEQVRDIIKTELFFTPKEYVPQSKYFAFRAPVSKKEVAFYCEDGENVYLPYFYAKKILAHEPNINHNYNILSMIFTGNLRDYQISVVQQLQQLLYEHHTVTIGLYPGFGKTVVGVKLACTLQLLTLIIIHLDTLIIQHINTILHNSNCRIWVVGTVKKAVKEVMQANAQRFFWPNKEPHFTTYGINYQFIICMEQRIKTIPNVIKSQIGTIIIDEAHHFCTASRVNALLAVQPLYIMLQSATPERSDDMHFMLHALVGTHGVFIEPNKHIEVFVIRTGFIPQTIMNKIGNTDYDKLKKSTYSNKTRIMIILKFLMLNVNYRTLILTSMIERCEELYGYINQYFPGNTDYIHGNKTEFYPHNILIGTVAKVGTGFDPLAVTSDSNVKHYQVVLLDMSIKKKELLTQTVGRGLRSNYPVVLQLLDDHKIYENHWKANLSWYKKRNAKIHPAVSNVSLADYNIACG